MWKISCLDFIQASKESFAKPRVDSNPQPPVLGQYLTIWTTQVAHLAKFNPRIHILPGSTFPEECNALITVMDVLTSWILHFLEDPAVVNVMRKVFLLISKMNAQFVSVHGQKQTTYSWWLKLGVYSPTTVQKETGHTVLAH